MTTSPLEPLVQSIEHAGALDGLAAPIGETARRLTDGTAGEVLGGSWLGHALHPLLTDVVVGSFMSATLLDLLGGDGSAANRLALVGIAAYTPTALTGINDWASSEASDPAVRRTGLVHAGANAAGAALYAASVRARSRGQRARGTLLGLAGFSVMGAGAYLGGHLSYRLGAGVAAAASAG